MRTLLTLLTLLFSLSFYSTWANEKIIPKEEGNFYGTTIREKELEEQLLESDLYKDCKEKSKNLDLTKRSDATNNCVNDALEKASDTDIKTLAEKADLASISQEQTKTAKGIRQYLSERLARAIYGKDYDAKNILSKKKFVDQTLFFDLYAEQLGKNVLLEVSNYCLENLRYQDTPTPPNNNTDPDSASSSNPLITPLDCFEQMENGSGIHSNKKYLPRDCLSKLVEINYPLKENGNTVRDNEIKQYAASVKSLQEASRNEIQTQQPDYFKKKSAFCAVVVQAMCNRYKCKQNSELASLPDSDCTEYGSLPSPPTLSISNELFGNQEENGIKACVVISKLREYKKTITQVQEMKAKLAKSGENGNGYNQNIYYDGAYQGGQGKGEEQSLSEITTISSREITENKAIKDIYLSEEEANELKERCLSNSDHQDCKKLVDTELKEKSVNMESAFNAVTQVRLKEIGEKIDTNDKEEIKDYLARLGLSSLYDESIDDPEKLKTLITEHYENERQALITEMKNKLRDKLKVQKDDGSKNDKDQITDVMLGTIDDLKNQKDRLETILHYNNVITSFLMTSEEDGSNASLNTVALQREMQDYEKYQDEEDKTDVETYFQKVTSDGHNTNQRSKATGLKYMDYIDKVLGGNQK